MHLWIRAEERENERRVGVTPAGVAELVAAGFTVTVEESPDRVIPLAEFVAAGATPAPRGSWRGAPPEAIIFGLKELPEDTGPLVHRHIMFGHAYKGQPAGRHLLSRFADGGGILYDLEYLVDESGRRVAAFGHWAGFVGAALSVMAWAAQRRGDACPPAGVFDSSAALVEATRDQMSTTGARPSAIVIGAKGRVGGGAVALFEALGVAPTRWDVEETASGGPFPEVLAHDIFINAILAAPGCPVFVPADATTTPRRLTVIGDVACDPGSEFSPVRVYDRVTTWEDPVRRVHDDPLLDVMAI
ncbi:MAG: saccharopine dehydrogenase, partial [Alphaproteobacteria bacterium]